MTIKLTERQAAMFARLKASLAASKGATSLQYEETYEAIIAKAKAEAEAAKKAKED